MPSGRILTADPDRVYLDGYDFPGVRLKDFLAGLARKTERRDATMVEYKRIRPEIVSLAAANPDEKLTRAEIMRQIQRLVTPASTIFAETGDSWFNGIKLELPDGARFEIEMQWGSIDGPCRLPSVMR